MLASVDETARIFVIVRFAGTPEETCEAAARVVDEARRILKFFGPDVPPRPALGDLAKEYEPVLKAFTEIAKAEFG